MCTLRYSSRGRRLSGRSAGRRSHARPPRLTVTRTSCLSSDHHVHRYRRHLRLLQRQGQTHLPTSRLVVQSVQTARRRQEEEENNEDKGRCSTSSEEAETRRRCRCSSTRRGSVSICNHQETQSGRDSGGSVAQSDCLFSVRKTCEETNQGREAIQRLERQWAKYVFNGSSMFASSCCGHQGEKQRKDFSFTRRTSWASPIRVEVSYFLRAPAAAY